MSRSRIIYELRPASEADRPWLDDLRRIAYADLVVATFGRFEEARHRRHFEEAWGRGNIEIVTIDGTRAGMIQLTEGADSIELREIQIHPGHQGKRLGQALVRDVIDRSIASSRELVLSTGLKNLRARAFYERLGFRVTGQSDTHFHMRFEG